jgi:hypothetical protein
MILAIYCKFPFAENQIRLSTHKTAPQFIFVTMEPWSASIGNVLQKADGDVGGPHCMHERKQVSSERTSVPGKICGLSCKERTSKASRLVWRVIGEEFVPGHRGDVEATATHQGVPSTLC